MKAKMTVYKNGGKTPIVPDPKKKMTDMEIAKANRMDMLTQERNTIRKNDPDALAAFDRGLKEQGFMVKKKPAATPVKKMMGGGKMDMYLNGGKVGNKVKRLENREANLVARGSKAVDEGRERKADRLLGKAARVENRVIKAKESKERQEMVKKIQSFILPDENKMMGGGKIEYGMGGKMKKYLMGGQVKIDKNKDGKISAIDFKMLKKK
jgi:hypothetical protein